MCALSYRVQGMGLRVHVFEVCSPTPDEIADLSTNYLLVMSRGDVLWPGPCNLDLNKAVAFHRWTAPP